MTTPFAQTAPTPVLKRPPPRRGNYTIIEEPVVLPPIINPAHLVAFKVDVEMVTPAMRRARRLHQKQKLYRDGVPPPPAPQPINARRTPQRRPKLPEGLYNGKVPPLYQGMTAVVFATGPSLTKEVVDLIRPYHDEERVACFGCNDAFRIVPYLDVSYACDPPWMHNAVTKQKWLEHSSVKWTQDRDMAPKYGLNWIAGTSRTGLSTNPELIHFGTNSGYQVLNLALLYGCQRFLLVGYNMSAPGGKKHFFGDHPAPMSRSTSYPTFIQAFGTIREPWRNRIINCTPDSKLDCFERADLKTELDLCTKRSRSLDSGQESPPLSSEPAPV